MQQISFESLSPSAWFLLLENHYLTLRPCLSVRISLKCIYVRKEYREDMEEFND